MIHTKKWTIMLVLTIMLVPIIKTKATSYVADDRVTIPSQYHDFFNNYFNGSKSYTYFPYSCYSSNYNRTCYFGIDSENNYINITYNGDNYNYNQVIEKGVDNNFSVTGNNVFKKDVDNSYKITYGLAFMVSFLMISLLLGGVFRDK